MQTPIARDINIHAIAQPAKHGNGRKLLVGACVAAIGGAAIALVTGDTLQTPSNLAATSIEGNVIVAFDAPPHAGDGSLFRVQCNAINGATVTALAEGNSSPVVVGGLAAGEYYDCRASMSAYAGTSKPVRVRVIGAD